MIYLICRLVFFVVGGAEPKTLMGSERENQRLFLELNISVISRDGYHKVKTSID